MRNAIPTTVVMNEKQDSLYVKEATERRIEVVDGFPDLPARHAFSGTSE